VSAADRDRWEAIWEGSFATLRRMFDKKGVAPPDDDDELAPVVELRPVEDEVEPEGNDRE
jgi:hypothetical protein